MATMDVSRVLLNPLFTTPVTLIPREQQWDEYQNPVWVDCEPIDLYAVVTADNRTLERLPESMQRAGTIQVRFIADLVPEYRASGYDAVEWRGKRFTVIDVGDYSQFGRGMLRLTCAPEDVSDGSY